MVGARSELCSRIECVDVGSREAGARAWSSRATCSAALILPAGPDRRAQSLGSLNPEQPTVEVLVNEEDPVKAQLVDDRISSLVTEANLLISQQVTEQAANYLDLLLEGRRVHLPRPDVRGPRAQEHRAHPRGARPASSRRQPAGRALERGDPVRGARARRTSTSPLPLLGAVAQPIEVEKEVVCGDSPTARHVRDLRRRDGDPDVRHRAAGRRLAGAGARGERLRAADPRAGRPDGAAGREGRARGGAARSWSRC